MSPQAIIVNEEPLYTQILLQLLQTQSTHHVTYETHINFQNLCCRQKWQQASN
jgi:hypothetical protein